MKLTLQIAVGVLIALLAKDRIDLFLLERHYDIEFSALQEHLLDFLSPEESKLAAESPANKPGTSSLPANTGAETAPQIQSATRKEQAWREWYTAVAPAKCRKPELKKDFVECTNIRIKLRAEFETAQP